MSETSEPMIKVPMNCWLRCPHCKTRELVQSETTFGVCPECGGGPRFAESDDGTPMYVSTTACDPASWDIEGGSFDLAPTDPSHGGKIWK